MKVAIPIFGTRVSPRFDCARDFLVVSPQDGAISDREEVSAVGWAPHERINRLLELGIESVVCGGIDCWSAQSLESAGVTIRAGVAGLTEDVLAMLVQGELEPAVMNQTGAAARCRHFPPACHAGRRAGCLVQPSMTAE